ncbi:testis-specific serine/threonine-protein kinase 3 [Cebus imitator]|uniref:Testis-specific serine/threonine-protein kinase 3 n=3 Tax=Cebidae TaxID=9498 RepID=A0A2K5S7B3_CEBIM|nr:testis-specific serine/threonine-protein kinase 3 [Saimiri boliviensis boliviensis]XP_017383426.1 testis-specific serine/threonine-protein kinase 3 [Cebus imitator]XP_032102653.1 testis-specific serine/threonine-protein kinase 3 [Sapajus apella]
MEDFLLSNGYQLGKTIGEGTYSKVKEAFSKKHQRKVAIKIIDKMGGPEEFIQRFLPRELQIVRTLDHKNIVQVYEMLESADGKIYLVMELAEGGDVFDCVLNGGPLPESRAKALFCQMVEAIRYCHGCGVAHRDLKCENALLQGFNLKLTDFGFAKVLPKSHRELSQTFCGSTAYAAPEVLQGIPHDSKKGDVWSMGVVLYVMLCASLPFDDTDIPKMLWEQQKGVSFPTHLSISAECQDLLKRLLEPDMILRPSIEEVSWHPWLAST